LAFQIISMKRNLPVKYAQ